MKVLYNYKAYEQPRQGIFNVEKEGGRYTSNGWETEQVKYTIIGETEHWYVYGLKPYSSRLNGDPECLLPDGIHKLRLQAWLTGQLQIF